MSILQSSRRMLERLTANRDEETLELAALVRICFRAGRFPDLHLLRSVSADARFPVGESPALRHRCNASPGRSDAGLRQTATLSRQHFRVDFRSAQSARL